MAHEINRTYCELLGDTSQPPWADAPDWQKLSLYNGVDAVACGRVNSPEDAHASWRAEKENDGWGWGPVKDPASKQHPCMMPFAQLPEEQRVKDVIFFTVVKTLLDFEQRPG